MVQFAYPDPGGGALPELVPVAVAANEGEVSQLLSQLLAVDPGCANLATEFDFHVSDRRGGAADRTGDTVHVVVTIDGDDGPTVRGVFDMRGPARRFGEELMRLGEGGFSVVDLVMGSLPAR